MLNLFTYIPTLLALIVISLVIFIRNPQRIINRVFSAMTFSVALWIATALIADTLVPSLFWARMTILGPLLMLPLMLYFSIIFPGGLRRLSKLKIVLIFLPTILFLPFIQTSLNIIDSIHHDWGGEIVAGPIYLLFNIYFLVYLGLTIINLARKFRNSRGNTRQQLKFVLIGISLTAFIAISFSGVLPVIGYSYLSIFGPPSALIFVSFTAYAITRHRFLDIRLIILRTISYSLLVLLISAFVVVVALLIPRASGSSTTTQILIAIAVAIFIVLILDPLKRFIGRLTDRLFFKARVDYDKLLADITDVINREIDVDRLLSSVSEIVGSRLKVRFVHTYLASKPGAAFLRRPAPVGQHLGKDKLAQTSSLVEYLNKSRDIIVLEALERKIEDTPDEAMRKPLERSKAELDTMDAAVVSPVVTGTTMNAVFVLGPKLSGDPYGSEDLNLLQLLGPQLASALDKSRLYDEVKQFTERLKKEIKVATEDVRNTNVQLQERNRFLSALQNVTNMITRTLDFKKVAQSIVDSVSIELGYIGGILLFLGKDRRKVFPEAITNSPLIGKILKLLPKPLWDYYGDYIHDDTITNRAMKTNKVLIGEHLDKFFSPPVPSIALKAIQKLGGIKTLVAVPISSEKEVVGAIVYGIETPQSEIKEADLNIMKALADQTGIVARNIELYRQVQESNKDLAVANEHLKQLDQAKSEFVSIASHQLRTPMTGIMGYLSMMVQGDFGKTPKELTPILKNLLEESQRMIRLINLFLNVSKIESGKLILTKQPTHIEELIDKVVSVVKKIADDKKLKLSFERPKEPMPVVAMDQDKVGDVLTNLIDNAIKYTDAGSVTVSVEQKKNDLRISVQDSGIGIAPQDAKELFNKFVRGFGIAQIHPDGSGLGLYVARRVTEAHGGKIWVESKGKGKGSTFLFTLPLRPSKELPSS